MLGVVFSPATSPTTAYRYATPVAAPALEGGQPPSLAQRVAAEWRRRAQESLVTASAKLARK